MTDLFQAARAAAERAYAPYSGFPVGAAIKAASGAIYSGCNVENAAYPEGWCAETSALSHMILAGEKVIDAIAVFAPKMPRITPCGGCRQRLAEFATRSTTLHLCDETGVVDSVKLAALLPDAFDLEA